jgi:hypothetical protein
MFALEISDFAALLEDVPFPSKTAQRVAEDEEEIRAASICARTFDTVMKGYVPKLQAARALDETLIRIFRYYATT